MEEVIGIRGTPGHGSLMEWGITYRELDLHPSGSIDWEALATAVVVGECEGTDGRVLKHMTPARLGGAGDGGGGGSV